MFPHSRPPGLADYRIRSIASQRGIHAAYGQQKAAPEDAAAVFYVHAEELATDNEGCVMHLGPLAEKLTGVPESELASFVSVEVLSLTGSL